MKVEFVKEKIYFNMRVYEFLITDEDAEHQILLDADLADLTGWTLESIALSEYNAKKGELS